MDSAAMQETISHVMLKDCRKKKEFNHIDK